MSDDADVAAEEIKARQASQGLAYVCTHVDEISAALAEDASGGDGLKALERVRSVLRGNGDISGPLADLHHALLRAGDALGVYGHVRGVRGLSLAGFDQGKPLEIVYRCPIGRCPRTVPGPAVTPPRCGVGGRGAALGTAVTWAASWTSSGRSWPIAGFSCWYCPAPSTSP